MNRQVLANELTAYSQTSPGQKNLARQRLLQISDRLTEALVFVHALFDEPASMHDGTVVAAAKCFADIH